MVDTDVDIDVEKMNENGNGDGEGEGEGAKSKCCNWYDGNVDAIGLSWLASGRGMLIMSNIFMSTSLLYLAKDAAGCFDEPIAEGQCNKSIYGMKAESFITNIATIAAVLAALFMPICGALVDYTPHRKLIGIVTATLLVAIQAIQIYTVDKYWFAMGVLQALAAFIYQLQLVVLFAYMPEIARQVGVISITKISSNLSLAQFASSTFFLIAMTGITIAFKTTAVVTGQISQGLNTLTSLITFAVGWFKYITPRPAVRAVPEGHWLLLEGFSQNWRTAKSVQKNYKHGLRYFLLAVVFAEASATAITTVSIVYLSSSIELSPQQIGIFFIVTVIAICIGTGLGRFITNKTTPLLSWKLSMIYLFITLMVGALVLDGLPLELKEMAYVWGLFVGLGLGWYYPTESVFFSLVIPPGQEAEFSGFFVYCGQILAWLFPLVFSILIEFEISQKYGVIVVASGLLIALFFLMLTCSWEDILKESNADINMTTTTVTAALGGEEEGTKNKYIYPPSLDEEERA